MEKAIIHKLQRRKAIRSALAHAAILAVGANHFPLYASPIEESEIEEDMGVKELVNTLREMKNEVCDKAALNLESSLNSGSALYLHLRSAGLDLPNALAIAQTLKKCASNSKSPLLSFSVSYNPELGDSGVVALAQALPQTLQEIGFVDCNIHDKGGEAILQWANQAPNLKIVCIERNKFTSETRAGFQSFSQSKPEVKVFF